MKLLVTFDFPPEKGGIQRYLSDIVLHTFNASDAVLVGCGRIDKKKDTYGTVRVCRVATPLSFLNKKFSALPMIFHVLRIFKYNNRNVEIYCGNVYGGIVAWAASFFMKDLVYAVYTYGTELMPLAKRNPKAWILKTALQKASKLYALGSFTAEQLSKIGITAQPVILPPRVDLPRLYSIDGLSAKPSEQKEDLLRILCVGRLVHHKGHAVLIRALSMLPATVRWQCVIAGNGPLYQASLKLGLELGLGDRLTMQISLTDEQLHEQYRGATLFILPSLMRQGAEGFGIVLLEAMSYSVPCIASKTGGIPEVLANGECGVLVEPGNATALCKAVLRLHKDKELRTRLGRKGFMRVKECYAW